MPLQGATAPTRDTQGVASLALGYVLHWAFSPPLLNPKLKPRNIKIDIFSLTNCNIKEKTLPLQHSYETVRSKGRR